MDQILTELQGGTLHVIINRPEKKNALTSAMYLAMVEAFQRAESDDSIRVIVLRSNGDSFTAGNDIEDFVRQPWKGESVPLPEQFIRAVAFATKPVIAAVHGLAVGVGTTILLHCDLVYAADDATFTMPFVNIGIVPEAGSTLLLPRLIGYQRAAELLLLGTPFTAQRAYELGMVNGVVPAGQLLAAVAKTSQALCEKPPGAIKIAKQLLKKPLSQELDRVIREEILEVAKRLQSPETAEAMTAFLQKRKPVFS